MLDQQCLFLIKSFEKAQNSTIFSIICSTTKIKKRSDFNTFFKVTNLIILVISVNLYNDR